MALALSTTEAEYVVAGRACQQALWMKQAIKDYDTHCEEVLVAKSKHPNLNNFINCKSVDPIFSSFNMSNMNIIVEHGASSSQAQHMNPKEQIEFEINSWFDQTTWDEVEREISSDEVIGKEEEENLSFGDRMAYKSYLSYKCQHREIRAKMGA
ncbi:hypothetical protein Tco_0860718 [Tanacetum coccineum]|uniref:Retrovirus-related Pol polyprotein from transposon TNT 1-94 n=1 Tax=Tanacetum coccineum TaxID=301880 RepID=A0ABQ5BGB4_9ASTR